MSVGLGTHLHRAARRHPGKPALVDHGETISYAQLDHRTDKLASAMLALGLGPGDRVAVLMDNAHEPIEAFAAAMKAGFTHVPLNSRLTAGETAELMSDAGAVALITDQTHLAVAETACAATPAIRHLIAATRGSSRPAGTLDFEALIEQAPASPPEYARTDARAFILYTSGTTGHAKGVTSTQHEILDQAFTAVLPEYGLTAASRLLALYPHSSAASTNCAFGPAWVLGATLIIDDVQHFTAERFLSNIERYQVTHATAVPTMLVRILRHVEEHGLQHDLATLQRVAYGSAPIAPVVTARLIEIFGPIFMQVYGMTEVSGICCTLRADEHDASDEAGAAKLRSCGKPVPGAEVEVVADDGTVCSPGDIGEVRIKSGFLMTEYWDDPARTAETLRDGWLYSGDLGRTDDEGYLYIVDRKKDLIISGGQNIISKEIEDAIYEYPGVLEAAAIGVPDDEWGERVHAFVSFSEGQRPAPGELEAFLTQRLASFKRPRAIEILPALPKNSVGKIAKSELREPFWRESGRRV
jgi:acyl-CoA synthetase (AMP-forming)/AMP-acid ligase II